MTRQSLSISKIRKSRVASGLCRDCGAKSPGYRCHDCNAKRAESQRERQREYMREYMRRRRLAH